MLLPFLDKSMIEAGCDEAGRGCLAGPVFAAAVILPHDFEHEWLKDSKLMTVKRRDLLRGIIEEKAFAWAVARAEAEEIDEINISNASFLAMHRALDQLKIKPDSLLIDGKFFKPPYQNLPHHCIIKGDSKYASIAAASVLAKTHRDEHLQNLAKAHPQYGWQQNKGYPTKAHRAAIRQFGASPHHRVSFKLLPS